MLHKRHTVTRITQLQKYHSDQNATQIIDKKHERLTPQWKLRVTPPVEIRKITLESPPVEIKSHPQWK